MGRIIKTVKSSGVGHIRGFQLGTKRISCKTETQKNGVNHATFTSRINTILWWIYQISKQQQVLVTQLCLERKNKTENAFQI